MSRFVRSAIVVALVAVMALAVGCAKEPEPTVEPKIGPPAVDSAGVLSAGVDLSMPPFAGTDQGKQAGIDVDVASAIAERLGLSVKFVDVKPSEAATALADGTADLVLSVPLASSDLSQLSLAGSYISNAPAFFIRAEGSVEPSMSLATVDARVIGVQSESEAFWLVRHQLDPETAQPFTTLREALEALDRGEVEVVAGDALVGAYIARDLPQIKFAGQLAGGAPLAIAVDAENTELADAVRGELDAMAADGVLTTIRRTWVGELPEITVEEKTAPATP